MPEMRQTDAEKDADHFNERIKKPAHAGFFGERACFLLANSSAVAAVRLAALSAGLTRFFRRELVRRALRMGCPAAGRRYLALTFGFHGGEAAPAPAAPFRVFVFFRHILLGYW